MKRSILVAAGALAVAGSSGALFALAAQEDTPQAFVQSTERNACRVLFFANQTIPGQFILDYASPAWKTEYERYLSAEPGTRARLGKDFWTSLDTHCDLSFGDTQVPAGHYYLALEKADGDGFNIVFFDSDEIRAKKLEAGFMAPDFPGGIVVPMNYEKTGDSEEELSLEFMKEGNAFVFEMLWGPHKLTQTVTAKI
jgi:hypothetical protein